MTDVDKVALLRDNLRYFTKHNIKIEGKNPGEVIGYDQRKDGCHSCELIQAACGNHGLEFNDAQLWLDYAANKMLEECGYVRIIVVKGRQQGISTYIEIRLFHKALFQPNTKICIISHEAKSTTALFKKVAFAQDNLPPYYKSKTKIANREERTLENDSSYVVLTAGSKESGRSQTAHHQHQSERAFFLEAEKIDKGAGQIVATAPGTEVYKESTGNGMNFFYHEVLEALAGKGKFRVVFIPWYWQREYREKVAPGFIRSDEEERLVAIYKLDDQQLQWRRDKIVELKGLRSFKQEYPNNLVEAFQASGNSFFDSDSVQAARNSSIKAEAGPLIISCDPGRDGDRTVIVVRRGRQVLEIRKYDHMKSTRLTGILKPMIDELKPDKVFIDWGMGHGTIDQLHEANYDMVEGVNFGGEAEDNQYLNKRAEMAFRLKDWLENSGEVNLPDDDDMAADIASMPDWEANSNGRKKFPPKEEIKKDFGRSPDILDALMLSFAYLVRSADSLGSRKQQTKAKNVRNGSALTTLSRVRSLGRDNTRRRASACHLPSLQDLPLAA